MTAYALQRKLENSGITVFSLHPGLVNNISYIRIPYVVHVFIVCAAYIQTDTEMSRHMSDMLLASSFVKTLKSMCKWPHILYICSHTTHIQPASYI